MTTKYFSTAVTEVRCHGAKGLSLIKIKRDLTRRRRCPVSWRVPGSQWNGPGQTKVPNHPFSMFLSKTFPK